MWNDTAFTRAFGLRYPIVQGPFGGGLSSPRLAATVSDAGGLGSFGAQGMKPDRIAAVVAEIRALTSAPFAVNLWVSTADARAEDISRADYDAAVAVLAPYYTELGVDPPTFPPAADPVFEEQAEALIEARPPIFSVIFGVPSPAILERCRARGIRTIGTATTVDEARALDAAGVEAIVATGAEAGGHRPSFLRSAEASLMGTVALVPQVADAVRVPVIAAGGIADRRGVTAALALGAAAVQIGTAFLACDESNAHPAHRAALRNAAHEGRTQLTRGFTGRLGRGLSNALAETLSAPSIARLPYPFQGHLVASLKQAALARGRADLAPFWSGQAVPLITHTSASDLFDSLVRDGPADGR
ncbi:MAG: nitronate monooxygenase [Vicinamibacteraceae bacterium]